MTDREEMNSNIGIVEDDTIFRKRFAEHLAGCEFVSSVREWKSAEDFITENTDNLDILFIDINLPGMSGIDLSASLSVTRPDLKRVILTTLSTNEHIMSALRSGCIGYMLKQEIEESDSIIKILMAGGALITPSIALHVMQTFRKINDGELNLTHREKQILELVIDGSDVQRVSEFLDISIHTVRDHVKNIYRKLNVSNRVELINVAKRMGFA
jgi:DNA-binding NarL/FixJ family response regulator